MPGVCVLRESLTRSRAGASIAGVRVNTLDVTPACPGRGLREKPASARKRGRFSIAYASPPRLPVIPCLTPSPTRLRDLRVEKPSTKRDPSRPMMSLEKASTDYADYIDLCALFRLSEGRNLANKVQSSKYKALSSSDQRLSAKSAAAFFKWKK